MKRISRILQIPESALNHYLQANETAKSRSGYETKKYKIELDEDNEEDLGEECETVADDVIADVEDSIEEVIVDEEESGEDEGENVINITPPNNDFESDADNANYWQDSDYEGNEGNEGNENETVNRKSNVDVTIVGSQNMKTVSCSNVSAENGHIKIEYEKQLLEHELEMRKMRRELRKRENEIEYLRNQIRIQDMIYFEKYLPFSEFIQNIIQRYQNQDTNREEYEKMSDEWKQYLEVMPNYEIKNLIYYIQNTDNIIPEFRNNFYRIFKEYYDYLTRMKEENIYTSRRNKIQDMWREWSKYANLFINIQSFDNVNKFRRLIDHQKKRETIEETILLGRDYDNMQKSNPNTCKTPNIRSRQMAGIAGKVLAAAALCGQTVLPGGKKKKEVITLDI